MIARTITLHNGSVLDTTDVEFHGRELETLPEIIANNLRESGYSVTESKYDSSIVGITPHGLVKYVSFLIG